jgi:hypothetical protein
MGMGLMIAWTCMFMLVLIQWVKKLSQCLAVLERLTWHKSSKLCNNLKIIDGMPGRIKHPIIGKVFLPFIILPIHPLYQPGLS